MCKVLEFTYLNLSRCLLSYWVYFLRDCYDEIKKRYYLHKFLSAVCSEVIKRKIIVFDACMVFHLKHFALGINEVIKGGMVDVYVIGIEQSNLLSGNVKYISHHKKLPLHRKVAAYVTTKFNTVYWLSCPNIHFCHGVGAKFNYTASDTIKDFDYIYAACKPVYDIQKKQLKKGGEIIKVGLPILEETPLDGIVENLNLNSGSPTILYAPSWCNDISMVSDINKIMSYLKSLAIKYDVNVIISPHPLLFDPQRCSGKDFFKEEGVNKNVFFNKPESCLSTLDIARVSDIVISDISSIMFEAMALNKIVIFDGNERIYKYCKALSVYEVLIKVCITPDWEAGPDDIILSLLKNDLLAEVRGDFISEYIFNISHAKDKFIKEINHLI